MVGAANRVGLGWAFVSGSMVLALSTSGCFLDRTPLEGGSRRDAGAPVDAGGSPVDASRLDAGRDAGPRDAGSRDAGPSCVERCDGERALTCRSGTVDCAAMGAFCALEAGRATCVPRVCAPGTTGCSSDGAAVVTCDARGTAIVSSVPCVRGCEAGACRPETPCGLPVTATVTEGTQTFDLCGAGNDHEHSDLGACFAPVVASGQDRIVRFEVSRPARYRFELRDVEDMASVDPVLYVRSRCADDDSVVACDNNGAGGLSARLEIDLPAGDHFLMIDSYDYSLGGGFRTGCGRVNLTVTRL